MTRREYTSKSNSMQSGGNGHDEDLGPESDSKRSASKTNFMQSRGNGHDEDVGHRYK